MDYNLNFLKITGNIQNGTKCQPTEKWYNFRKKGFDIHSTKTKGKRRPLPLKEYGVPTCAIYNQKIYDYVSSRKDIYVPIYKDLIQNTNTIKELNKMLNNGINIMIIDGDGPPKELYPNGMEITHENWNRMINDTKYPFVHGYVVAGILSGFL